MRQIYKYFAYLCKKYILRMKDNDWKNRLGVVFSTDPDFKYAEAAPEEEETPSPAAQRLVVSIDRRNRGGKQVTIVRGFRGRNEDLCALGRTLRVKCGTGGSAGDGEIIVQGDFRDKVTALLREMGYGAKRGN